MSSSPWNPSNSGTVFTLLSGPFQSRREYTGSHKWFTSCRRFVGDNECDADPALRLMGDAEESESYKLGPIFLASRAIRLHERSTCWAKSFGSWSKSTYGDSDSSLEHEFFGPPM